MNPPSISIITRTKDRPEFLRRALDSILAQTRGDWHWLVVDAGDAGETEKVIRSREDAIGGRVTHLETDPDSTIGAMSNLGLDHARTRFVTHLDDDDTWDPRFFEAMLGHLEKNEDPRIAGTVCRTLCVEEKRAGDGTFETVQEFIHNLEMRNVHIGSMATVNQFCVHAFVYETRVLDTVGRYDAALPVLDDWDFNLRFLRYFDVKLVAETLARYHLRPGLESGVDSNSQFERERLHRHIEAIIINRHVRADLEGEGLGLGQILASSSVLRSLDDRVRRIEKRLASVSDKTGKIDSRTKALKDKLT